MRGPWRLKRNLIGALDATQVANENLPMRVDLLQRRRDVGLDGDCRQVNDRVGLKGNTH